MKCAAFLFSAAMLGGCANLHAPAAVTELARLTPVTTATRDLQQLPPPLGKIVVAVYGFRDQTGQFKPAPDSSFSTSVTQGAASILMQALRTSGWYTPVERENLQDLLTERKIVRALGDTASANLPQLLPATILIEGGIIAFESNVRTGGLGARYLGVGLSTQYRVDQVSVSLRSVDIRDGQVLNNVSTTKTIYSYEVRPSVFKFVNFKDLVEVEAGMTRNEPAQLCVREAIEAAVLHLTVLGVRDRVWALKNPEDSNAPVMQATLRENEALANMPLRVQ
jgi:curli production assembly/transport component CsgG